MPLPPAFLEELRARTPLAAVIGRRVKLQRSGHQWKGCCPFHGEKTPSFYVYDDHFHCFGCGAHGDAISFVMQSQGSSFSEAVEQLAAEAGLEVPRPSAGAVEAERRRQDLHEVLQGACAFFQRRLFLPEGARGLEYLRGRGLSEETIRRFALGWSGDGRGGLIAELGRDGITPAQLIEAGLVRPAEEGRPERELFYNRVMFPIRDRRGRVISFGGRLLGDGQPKYVNGPETPVFSKRRTLFGLAEAREAVRDGAKLVAVEGYMDVIALHQAGFGGAVAPLGTALTEEQLGEMWRLADAPILCFDGDAAGARAAARGAELALPLLAPGRTLKFVSLPTPEDPDSLVRKRGAADFAQRLEAARPLVETLFEVVRERTGEATPEQRAALRTELEAAAARIPERSLAGEYRKALLDRFYQRRRELTSARFRGEPSHRAVAPPHLAPDPAAADPQRARSLLWIVLRYPMILRDVEEAFCEVALAAPLARLREAILAWEGDAETLDSPALMNHLQRAGLAPEVNQVLALDASPLPAGTEATPAEALAGWWHYYGLMMHRSRLDEQVAAAERACNANATEAAFRRLAALCEAREALRRGELAAEQQE